MQVLAGIPADSSLLVDAELKGLRSDGEAYYVETFENYSIQWSFQEQVRMPGTSPDVV
jgi:hypothetical protein